jgi:hypothetical protein
MMVAMIYIGTQYLCILHRDTSKGHVIMKLVKTALLTTIAILAFSSFAMAQEEINYTWSAPTEGSTVVHYVVQHQIDGGSWANIGTVTVESYTLTADYDITHSIRVAGVDSEDRQGPWSIASDPYTPTLGAPGQPGKPTALF